MASPLNRRPSLSSLALILLLIYIAIAVVVEAKSHSKEKICSRNFDCINGTYCCNGTSIWDFFQPYQFENLFSKRNAPTSHAVQFYDYQSFIAAASIYEPLGFCTTGGVKMQMQELAAFFGMVGCKTSCGYGVATGGPLAYGLCYNREMSPSQSYCQEDDYVNRCSPGAEYYGRGALPVYWNYNYGLLGKLMKLDLLNHPEMLEQNATLAFQSAIVQWMTPKKKDQPSAHDCFAGNFIPSKNDTLEKRVPGFGCAMNVLYGDELCGRGFIDEMNNCISHYQYYLDLMGVGRQYSGENLNCAEQKPFNPSAPKETAASSFRR